MYSRVFKDFLSTLDALSNARVTYQVLDLIMLEIYLSRMSYDLQKTPPNYQLVFPTHTDSMWNSFPLLTPRINS